MSDLLTDIADYLVAEGLATAKGTDIFKETLPDVPDAAIALFEYSGVPPNFPSQVVGRYFQVQTRDYDPDTAREKSWAIYRKLNPETENIPRAITQERWGLLRAQDTPAKLKVDSNGRTIYFCNYAVITKID